MAAQAKANWAEIKNGALVNMRKPVSFHREDEHLEIVLAYIPRHDVAQHWVTWTYNRENGSCTGGHYFDTRKQAVEDFKDRGRLRLLDHNEDPDPVRKDDEPGGNWEKVSKPPVLGHDQAGTLRVIKERGSWYRSSGWNWGTLSATRRIMASLVKKGLVEVTEKESLRDARIIYKVYTLTERAEELFEKKIGSNWWKYKDGAIQEIKRPSR